MAGAYSILKKHYEAKTLDSRQYWCPLLFFMFLNWWQRLQDEMRKCCCNFL